MKLELKPCQILLTTFYFNAASEPAQLSVRLPHAQEDHVSLYWVISLNIEPVTPSSTGVTNAGALALEIAPLVQCSKRDLDGSKQLTTRSYEV